MRLLMSEPARASLSERLATEFKGDVPICVAPGEDADIAFISRDVTGLSTKHHVMPQTQVFYDGLLGAPSLKWVHVHSAGADRPVLVELRRRGVTMTTSSGTNASIVAQTALAGVLALARDFPRMMAAQRERRWASLMQNALPRDLEGQGAVVVGWGPIGQRIGALLSALGLSIAAVRSDDTNTAPADTTVPFERIAQVLPRADWLILACPLSARTRGLIDAAALSALPAGARVVNVARGEIVDEAALIERLRDGHLHGAFLDVFAQEPLPTDSPLWDLPNVIVTPHSAGHSDGNEGRVANAFLDNLRRWRQGAALMNIVKD